jgi:hypothetical protein
MANDAARVWVSPHFTTVAQIGEPAGMAKELVWVLNPNDTVEKVTLTIYDQWGIEAEEQERAAGPSETVAFVPSETVGAGDGWVRVSCDKPVLPWGVCLHGNNYFRSYVQMAFYRAEGIQLQPIVRVPISEVKHK